MAEASHIEVPEETPSTANMTGLDHFIAKIGKGFSFLFLVSGCVIVFEVVARYVFGSPTIWAHETTTLLCALCFAFGGAYCLAKDTHIRIVVVYEKVPLRFRRYLDIFNTTVGLIWGGFLVWAGWLLVEKSWFTPQGALHMETTGSAWNPPFPAIIKLFLFIILIVMTAQFLLKLFKLLGQR